MKLWSEVYHLLSIGSLCHIFLSDVITPLWKSESVVCQPNCKVHGSNKYKINRAIAVVVQATTCLKSN